MADGHWGLFCMLVNRTPIIKNKLKKKKKKERTRVNRSKSSAGGNQGQQVQVSPKWGSQSLGHGETKRGTRVTWCR